MNSSTNGKAKARQTIYAQEKIPLSIKRTAWILYQHELTRVDPRTCKPFIPRKALSNTLKWMAFQKERQEAGLKQLSPMQTQILEMLVHEGLSQKQIAHALQRNPDTIKHHCERIRRKVGVNSMYQVVAVAVDLGWVTAPQVQE
jgi:DNA-binding NarL/FixJ family response regulator